VNQPAAHVATTQVSGVVDVRANDRAQLLCTIRSLSPLLQELGGQEAMTAVARAILDVTSWWP